MTTEVRGVLVDQARLFRRWNQGVVFYAPSFQALLDRYEMRTSEESERSLYFYVADYPPDTKRSAMDRDARRVIIEKCYLADWDLQLPVPRCVYCERPARFWRWTVRPGPHHQTVLIYPLCQHHSGKRKQLSALLEMEL